MGSPGSASGGAVHAADLHASGLGTIRQSAGLREDLLSRPSVVQYGRCIQENAASPGLPAGGHEEELRYERHRHRYEFNNEYRQQLTDAGLVISGTSPDGRLVESIEVKNHPFFIGTQAHPELKSRPNNAHPLFRGFVDAILELKK